MLNTLSTAGSIRYVMQSFSANIGSKTKGPEEKGAPSNHPEILSQKLADLDRAPLCHFRRRILGQYAADPCSPGPFGLLLKTCQQNARNYHIT